MEGVKILHLWRFQGKTKIQVKEFVFSCFLLFSFVFFKPAPAVKKIKRMWSMGESGCKNRKWKG